MRGRSILAAFLLAAAVPAASQDPQKSPVPDAADQKRAEKVIRDFFRADYQAKDPAARSALAGKLLKEAAATQGDAVAAYVLLREARDAAADAGDIAAAFEAVARMAERFDVKADEMKAAALSTARKKASTADDLAKVAEAFLALAEDQAKKGDFDGALRGAREAESAARSARDAAAAQRAASLAKDVPEMKRAHDQYAKAELTLSANPADPEANLACGRYLCLVRDDWEAGLPLLAKGSNAALADAAVKELAKPEDVQGMVEVADLWWDLADKNRNPFDKRRLQARARIWYERASPDAAALTRIRIEKRLSDLGPATGGAAASASVDLLRLIDPPKDAVEGDWSFSGRVLVTPPGGKLQIPYIPPAEYDITIVAEKKDIALFYVGLISAGTPFSVFLDCKGSTATCIGLFGQGLADEPSTLFAGEAFSRTAPSTVVCSVRRTAVTVTVDRKKLVEYKGDSRKLLLDPNWTVPDTKALAIGSNSPYNVSKIVLTPVSGQGRRLR